jgi:Fur family transcriptional regulator, ferric uptake regulator
VANESNADLKDEIRKAGLRATASRIAVLRYLRQSPRPLSHAEVVEALTEDTWDRATLYRNLVDLVGAGMAQKVELGDRLWRFSAAVSETHDGALHPHFICTACGTIACLPEVSMSTPKRGVPRSFRDKNVEVHVRGLCDECN